MYISQFTRFVRKVNDFIARNKRLSAELFKQGYRYNIFKISLTYNELFSKFNVGYKRFCMKTSGTRF